MAVYNDQVCRVVIASEYDGQLVNNVFHWANDPSSVEWDIDRVRIITEVMADWATSQLSGLLSNRVRWLYAKGTHLIGPGGFSHQTGMTGTGGRVAEGLPGSVALCITASTGKSGRSYHGRSYLAGLPGDAVDFNRVSDQYKQDVELAYNAMLTAEPFTGFLPVVYSTRNNGGPRLVGLPSLITSYLLTDLVVDSQRRRLPGRGR